MATTSNANSYDVIVIGAGSNGLVAATALAKAGKRVLVVERAEHVGGQSRTMEIALGFRAAPLRMEGGWVPPAVVQGLGLTLPPTVNPVFTASVAMEDGRLLSIPADPARAVDVIRPHSARDASRWLAFTGRLRKLAGFLEALYQLPAPEIETKSFGELPSLLGLGRKFRALGKADMSELLRVMPMCIQDLLDDEFESEPLKAAIGAGAVRDIRQGPRSGGTSFVLLHYLAGAIPGSVRTRPQWQSAPDAFEGALALRGASLGVKFRARAGVERIMIRDDIVTGVVLAGGEEINASMVLSTANPVHTLSSLVDPVWLDPEVLHAVRNIKLRGCTAYVLYALDGAPPGLDGDALASPVSLTSSLTALERAYDAAKYGGVAAQPHIELTLQTARWPSFAPAGKHAMIARVHYAPHDLVGAEWDAARGRALIESTTAAIARVMPTFAGSVVKVMALTPPDLAERFGVTGGAVTHGELTLDQILFMRPLAGWGRYSTPIPGLFLGGAGSHPGPGVLGGAGWLAAKQMLKG